MVFVLMLRRLVLATLVLATTGFVVWSYRILFVRNLADSYEENALDWSLLTSFLAGAVIAVAAGAVLWDRQPGNRWGVALIGLGRVDGGVVQLPRVLRGRLLPTAGGSMCCGWQAWGCCGR